MPRFIQFMHPGGQPGYGATSTGTLPWNLTTNPHTRKFIDADGQFLTSSSEVGENISFWGEWEPDSSYTSIPGGRSPSPIARNAIPNSISLPTLGIPHSTDPYVFDQSFFYTNCKQTTFHRALQSIADGSIILFGSKIGGNFCLDTLFVVSTSFSFTPNSFTSSSHHIAFSNRFINAVINPLIRVSGSTAFQFYVGSTFYNPYILNGEKLFSFVPCSSGQPFDRPIINSDFINHDLGLGIKCSELNWMQLRHEWNSIVSQLFAHGLNLGIRIN